MCCQRGVKAAETWTGERGCSSGSLSAPCVVLQMVAPGARCLQSGASFCCGNSGYLCLSALTRDNSASQHYLGLTPLESIGSKPESKSEPERAALRPVLEPQRWVQVHVRVALREPSAGQPERERDTTLRWKDQASRRAPASLSRGEQMSRADCLCPALQSLCE